MQLTVLGCSGSVCGPGSAASGYLIEHPGMAPIVMECGPGVFGALQRYANPAEVSVILSHLHADHCLDIPAMLVWRRYHPESTHQRTKLYGPVGTAERLGRASSEFPEEIDDISDVFAVGAWVENEVVTMGDLSIIPQRVNHPPATFGLRITDPQGKVLAFSGDSAPCEALVNLAHQADVFLCEAQWEHNPDVPPALHMSGLEAGEIAAKAEVKKLVLTHVPPWTSVDAVVAEAKSVFSGTVIAARPDLQITI